ncbi:MAG: alpha/beta fold hydrolase [Burkholderiaceae bacterium]
MHIATSPSMYAYTGGRTFNPSQPTLVFIHGAQHDHSVWILQSRWFAHRGYSVLAFDLPGHMRSAGPPLASVEAMADAVAAAIAVSGAQRTLLVGQSMGSLIALEVARRNEASTIAVALIGTASPMKVSDALLTATREDPTAAMEMINVWSHGPQLAAFDRKPSNPGPGFSVYWQNQRLMERIEARNGAEVLALDFAACNAYVGGLDAARALTCPALVIQGESDSMTPLRAAQSLIEALADVEVVRLPHTGHSVMAENPEGARRALAAFAQRVFARAESAR